MDILELVAQVGGIGAIFAVIMFGIYRRDKEASEKRAREDRKFMEDRLTTVLGNYRDDCERHSEAFGKMRESLIELTTWLKRKNGTP